MCSRRSAASVEQVGSVVLADGGRGAFTEGVEEADGVGLAGELPDVGLVGPVEAVTSSLAARWPPVILQRKTRAMMPRGMFL